MDDRNVDINALDASEAFDKMLAQIPETGNAEPGIQDVPSVEETLPQK